MICWNNTLEKLDLSCDIVFFGDSLTRGSSFHEYFPDKKIVNLGFSGDTISGMINRVNMIKTVSPKTIFFMGGINSLSDYNSDRFFESYIALIDLIIKEVPNSTLYIQSILPISKKKEFSVCRNKTICKINKRIKNLSDEKNIKFIDLHSKFILNGELNPAYTTDGLHLSQEAYDLWAKTITDFIALN